MKLALCRRMTQILYSQKGFFILLIGLFVGLASPLTADTMKIAFTSDRNGNFEIYVMDADGTNPVRLTKNPASDNSPTWSPDGKRIAFTSNPNGVYDIYAVNVDGSNRTNLTHKPAGDFGATWSPDGKRIAYGSNIGNEEIYIMSADGTNQTNLTRHGKADRHPDWSPDGTKIVFTSDRDGDREIYVIACEWWQTHSTDQKPGAVG